MDIQGGELSALQGSAKKLSANKIGLLFIEVEFARIYKNQPLFYEICDFLAKNGYLLFDICNISHSENGQIVAGDAIFLSPKVRKDFLGAA